jgi:hypothetical protein
MSCVSRKLMTSVSLALPGLTGLRRGLGSGLVMVEGAAVDAGGVSMFRGAEGGSMAFGIISTCCRRMCACFACSQSRELILRS